MLRLFANVTRLYFLINDWFMRQRARYEARGKFGEHASFLSAPQTSSISMDTQLTHEPIVL